MYFSYFKKISFLSLLSATFFLNFLLISAAHAQTNALRISMIPQHPGPFEKVSVSVEDFSRDLNKVQISWSLNGKVEKTGTGLKSFEFNTGALGSVSSISINMGGEVQTLTVRPTVTDIIWQADTYTPPFYQGKSLHSNQDPITLVAEPFFITSQGDRLDPEKLVYKWTYNGKVNSNASGYGKKTFTVSPSILLKPIEVVVEVTSPDNSYHSLSKISIADTKPEVLLYENDPLYGIHFENTLNNKDFPITSQEIRVFGVPLFFSRKQKNENALDLNWRLNGTGINQTGPEVIFRKPEGSGGGRSSIYLEAKNPERYAQFANASFYAVFSDAQSTNSSSQTVF